jgi:hypothetical protein
MNSEYKSKLSGYAHLVAVLRSLEEDIGMGDLTPLERNIIAALSLDEFKCGAKSETILTHKLLDRPTMSSFYRALKNLRSKKLVEVVGDRKTGSYRISY